MNDTSPCPDGGPVGVRDPMLTVATWNCAHGRSVGPDLRRLLPSRRRATLAAIGATLDANDVDVVALQELDGPSWWSGRFDHGRAIAEAGGYRYGVHGHHVHRAGLRYGTGLLSRRRLGEPHVARFAPTPPTPPKGYVAARVLVDGHPVDVVSVHLDFARAAARQAQLQELAAFLATRRVPQVVLGDVNDALDGPTVQAFLTQAGLRTLADPTPTFLKLGVRIDGVFVSDELEVDEQRVLPVDLSDHRPIVARVRIR